MSSFFYKKRKSLRKKSSSDSSSEESEESSSSEKIKETKRIKKRKFEDDSPSDDSYNEKNDNINNNTNQNPEELTKCYICLNQSVNPVICRFCGNMACKKCFTKWIESNSKCAVCRKNIKKEDLISPPIIKNINNYINKLEEEKSHEICKIHNEKILFFCMKCLKKYCGKCLFFGSEEAQKHQGHNIIDYSLLKNSEYNDIINKLETSKDCKDKVEEVILKNDNYKEEIKIIYENSRIALKFFQKIIEKKLQNKIDIISKFSGELKNTKEDLNKNYNDIIQNLNKLQKIDDKIENFDVHKSKDELDNILNKINKIKSESSSVQNKKIEIELKLNEFNISRNYNDLLIASEKELVVFGPSFMKMELIEKNKKEEFLKISFPNKDESSFFVYVLIKINNKIYPFHLFENEDNNENKNIKLPNDDSNEELNKQFYIIYIPKSELSQNNNNFYFYYYSFSID